MALLRSLFHTTPDGRDGASDRLLARGAGCSAPTRRP
jgi:hypothetical protein